MRNCHCLCKVHNRSHVSKIVVTKDMVTKKELLRDDFGNIVMLSSSIGYLQNIDIGNTIYIKNGLLTMSSKQQDNSKKIIVNYKG